MLVVRCTAFLASQHMIDEERRTDWGKQLPTFMKGLSTLQDSAVQFFCVMCLPRLMAPVIA
jgi:hypothetical protein